MFMPLTFVGHNLACCLYVMSHVVCMWSRMFIPPRADAHVCVAICRCCWAVMQATASRQTRHRDFTFYSLLDCYQSVCISFDSCDSYVHIAQGSIIGMWQAAFLISLAAIAWRGWGAMCCAENEWSLGYYFRCRYTVMRSRLLDFLSGLEPHKFCFGRFRVVWPAAFS